MAEDTEPKTTTISEKTRVYLTASAIFGGAVLLIGGAFSAGVIWTNFTTLREARADHAGRISGLETRVQKLETQLTGIENGIKSIDTKQGQTLAQASMATTLVNELRVELAARGLTRNQKSYAEDP
jgi:hypothetical protein